MRALPWFMNDTVPPFAIVTLSGEKLPPEYATVAVIGAFETGTTAVGVFSSVDAVDGGGVAGTGAFRMKYHAPPTTITRTTTIKPIVDVFI